MLSDYLTYLFVPRAWYRHQRETILGGLDEDERAVVAQRVAYYNKLSPPVSIGDATTVGHYHFPIRKRNYQGTMTRLSTFFFDLFNVLKYFPSDRRFLCELGDVTEVPAKPAFVKSRPIGEHNANAVVLKLNAHRHFKFVTDNTPFREKKDMLVSRTTWCNARPWRRRFCEMFVDHPMCDVGKSRPEPNEDFQKSVKGYMSREEQMRYKFIACIEGNDVATSLKWVMSSNSVAVSPPMRYETWFMEGRLIPGYHYIEVRPDYSDLIDKLHYYIDHPAEAEAIIAHAHEWVRQFLSPRLELATQLAVADKYFKLTNE